VVTQSAALTRQCFFAATINARSTAASRKAKSNSYCCIKAYPRVDSSLLPHTAWWYSTCFRQRLSDAPL